MAGSLILLDEFTASGQSEIIIGSGSNGSSGLDATMDSTYNVYVITVSGLNTSTDNRSVGMKFVISGVLQSASAYDRMGTRLDAVDTYGTVNARLQSTALLNQNPVGNDTGEEINAVLHFFNFSDANTHSHSIKRTTSLSNGAVLHGFIGGDIYRVKEAHDGVGFYVSAGTIDSGDFKLFGLKK